MAMPRPYNEIGLRLRMLRKSKAVTGSELARRLGEHQSRISRIESGHIFPQREFVERAAKVLGLTQDEELDLMAFYQIYMAEVRFPPAGRLDLQQRSIAEMERTTRQFRIFCPFAVPGLLQTPEYARALYSWPPSSAETVEADVVERLARQAILQDTSRRFQFVVTESGLANRICSLDVLREQLAHIRNCMESMQNISFRIVPQIAPLRELPVGAFSIYDQKMVLFDTYASVLILRQDSEIIEHQRIYADFEGNALNHQQSNAYLDVIFASHLKAQLALTKGENA